MLGRGNTPSSPNTEDLVFPGPGTAVADGAFVDGELPPEPEALVREPAVKSKGESEASAVVRGKGRSKLEGSPVSVVARENSFGNSAVSVRVSNKGGMPNELLPGLGAAFAFDVVGAGSRSQGRGNGAPNQDEVFDEPAVATGDLDLEIDLGELDVKPEALDRVAVFWVSECDLKGCDSIELLPTSVDLESNVATSTMKRSVVADVASKSRGIGRGVVARAEPAAQSVGAQSVDTSGGYIVVGATANGTQGTYGVDALRSVPTYSIGQQSGAVQTTYEFEYPPVAAGPAPFVGLTYSSTIADGANGGTNNNLNHVGFGWNFAAGGVITRQVEACSTSGLAGHVCLVDPRGAGRNSLEDGFSISLNGVSSRLIFKSRYTGTGASYIEYAVESNPQWRVFRMTNRVDSQQHDIEGTTWVVSTPDGTRYEFGGDSFAGNAGVFQSTNAVGYGWAANSPVTNSSCVSQSGDTLCPIVTKWMLNRIVDVSGNAGIFVYSQDLNWYQPPGWTSRLEYTRDVRLVRMDLGGVENTNNSTSMYAVTGANVQLYFAWPARPTSQVPTDLGCASSGGNCSISSPAYFNTHVLAGVFPQSKNTSGTWVKSHDYVFTQNAVNGSDLTQLVKISRREPVSPYHVRLAVDYGYTMSHDNRAESSNNRPTLFVPRMNKIVNEFGGEIRFAYGHAPNAEWNNPGCPPSATTWNKNTCDFYPGLYGGNDPVLADDWVAWYRWPVTTVTHVDPMAGAPNSITTYSYPDANSTADYTANDSLCAHNGLYTCHGADWTTWNQFRGYPWTKVTNPAGSSTKTWFYRGMNGDQLTTGQSCST